MATVEELEEWRNFVEGRAARASGSMDPFVTELRDALDQITEAFVDLIAEAREAIRLYVLHGRHATGE